MSGFVAQLASLPRSRVVIGGMALFMTLLIMTGFLVESRWGYVKRRVVPVVFVKSWPATRNAADIQAEHDAEAAVARAEAATSRAYIATLPAAARAKAQAQYDAYISAQPKYLQPEGFVPAPVPKPVPPKA